MKKQKTKQKFELRTINSRTQKRLEIIKKDLNFYNTILQEKFPDNLPQIEALINKWLNNKKFTVKLTREDSFYGRLNLAFEFPASKKSKDKPYKIQGRWNNDYKHWVWTMADLDAEPLITSLSEDARGIACRILFNNLLYKFLCFQILENEAKAVEID